MEKLRKKVRLRRQIAAERNENAHIGLRSIEHASDPIRVELRFWEDAGDGRDCRCSFYPEHWSDVACHGTMESRPGTISLGRFRGRHYVATRDSGCMPLAFAAAFDHNVLVATPF